MFVYALAYMVLVDGRSFIAEEEGFGLLKVVNYFGVMLLGGVIGRSESSRVRAVGVENGGARRMLIAPTVVGMLGLALWASEYIQILVFNRGFSMQYLIHVGNALFGVACLNMALIVDEFFPEIHLPRWLRCIADSTLEIYLVQVTIRPLFNGASFLFSPILFILTVMILGVSLHWVVTAFSRQARTMQ